MQNSKDLNQRFRPLLVWMNDSGFWPSGGATVSRQIAVSDRIVSVAVRPGKAGRAADKENVSRMAPVGVCSRLEVNAFDSLSNATRCASHFDSVNVDANRFDEVSSVFPNTQAGSLLEAHAGTLHGGWN